MTAKLFFSRLGWFFAWIFVAIGLLIKFNSLKSMSKKYDLSPQDFDQDTRFNKVYRFCKLYLYWKQISIVKSGIEKISDKPMLFVANHRSDLDPLIIFKIICENPIPSPIFIAKAELTLTKIAPILSLIDVIYIDRENLRQLPEVFEQQMLALKNKDSLVIFPEGTRNTEQDILDFKPGALTAAYKSFVAIQPIVLSYEDNLLSKSVWKTKERIVKVKLLKPYQPIEFINIEKQAFCKQIQTNILKEYLSLKNEK